MPIVDPSPSTKVMRIAIVCAVALAACSRSPVEKAPESASSVATAQPNSATSPSADGRAEIGKAAPDFSLKDLEGRDVKLSSFKGKVVVLEWFNPGCPFVKNAHTKGSLKEAAKQHTANGVVWLAVNSGAAGKQGAGVETNRDAAKTFGMAHPILLDETGDVGKKYGATNTPHMYVIDSSGTLVYRGAIDNSPDGEGQSPTGGKLVSYVDEALASIGKGAPVATSETKAYGCSVKYGK